MKKPRRGFLTEVTFKGRYGNNFVWHPRKGRKVPINIDDKLDVNLVTGMIKINDKVIARPLIRHAMDASYIVSYE